ncbi:MAG: hypothetical protein KAT91_00735 [Candidatus Aenigmarchaeota archaeon]|nr:hypothetical protein [Candidatus Aenigmarchaeota archaeon]
MVKYKNNTKFVMHSTRKKKNTKLLKFGVYAVAFLFIGSMIGIAVLESGTGPKSIKLPKNPILENPLDEGQIALFISQGGTYIEIETVLCDFDCMTNITKIESLASTYTPYVYVYKEQNSKKTQISIENYHKKETIESINPDVAEDIICEIIPGHPECIKRSALKAVLFVTKNETNNTA